MAVAGRVMFRRGPAVDMWLLLAVVLIVSAGLVNLYSATSVYADTETRARLADIYVTQVYWMVVGGLLAIFVAAIDYRHYERFAGILYAGGLMSLGLVFILGTDVRGSSRWIQLGSFTFQPSEFMKVLLVLMVARHVHNDNKTEPRTLIDLAIPGLLILVPVVLVMIQPDLGTGLILSLSSATILLMTRIRRRTLAALVLGLGAVLPLAWNYGMKQYQKDRITSFLDPEHDRTGIGWHALQSQTAIGNGQVLGEGFMQGTQNQFGFLPDQFSDFPFAVFAEDWGFLGCVALLGVYCFICIYAIHVASEAKDRFGAALATGVGALIFWHTIFNVGMAIGVLPVVGVTLPLFSYGGSNVVTTLIALGLLMNVSMRR
ncbi:MAG TPA: rod shape-determining protein RodA [Polyangiaceae bacterium]|nr:rod shape-determining protein RodA [Polyangiaceae bacterium]